MRGYSKLRVSFTTLGVLLTLLMTTVSAYGEDYIYVGGWSHHFNQDDHPVSNESHNLVAYESHSWMIGSAVNSYDNTIVIVGRVMELAKWHDISARLLIGADYGYYSCEYNKDKVFTDPVVCPILSPELVYTKYPVQPSFSLKGNALLFSTRWVFD